MMVVKTPKQKTKKKKKKKMKEPMEIDTEEGPSWNELEQRLQTLQTFNAMKQKSNDKQTKTAQPSIEDETKYNDNKQEQKSNQMELSEYNINHHCTELIWCEVSKQNEKYLNFLKLYAKTSKNITMEDLFTNTMLKYVEKSYFEQHYKYKNIKHDINALCVLLWTSSDCHQYKKIPKGIDKEQRSSFQIHKYIQNSLINDDKTGLKLSMKVIRGINNMINNHPTSNQLIGYRGSKMNAKEFGKFKVNEQRRVAMYVACSMNKRIAELFIGRGHVLITIIIPEGCLNARIVPSPMTMFPKEVEILIPPYSLFKCIGKKESVKNNKTVRELVLMLTKDNKNEKFHGLKNVPYWTA